MRWRRFLRVAMAAAAIAAVFTMGIVAAPPAAHAAPRVWRLVALGDSIPYGGRYCGNCTPFPSLLASALAGTSGHDVIATNLGVPGLTTAQLLANVRGLAAVRASIAAADIVTITVGHNDTPWNSRHDSCDGPHAFFGPYKDARWSTYTGPCLATEADALRARLTAILVTIRSLRGTRRTLIELTTDWNQLLGKAGVTAEGRLASRAVLDRFAAVTCAAAKAAGARCGDVYHAFNGPHGMNSAVAFLAADHDHASQAGHRVIANLLAAFGVAPLVV